MFGTIDAFSVNFKRLSRLKLKLCVVKNVFWVEARIIEKSEGWQNWQKSLKRELR
jgi:hypothetical protein